MRIEIFFEYFLSTIDAKKVDGRIGDLSEGTPNQVKSWMILFLHCLLFLFYHRDMILLT